MIETLAGFNQPATNGSPALEHNNRCYNIMIEQQDYGYTIRVGCKTLCIESKQKLIEKLNQYINDPITTWEKFAKGELFE